LANGGYREGLRTLARSRAGGRGGSSG
jgi:hypothetical protein